MLDLIVYDKIEKKNKLKPVHLIQNKLSVGRDIDQDDIENLK